MSKLLWSPSQERIQLSNMYRFMSFVNERHGLALSDYERLYQWSVDHIDQLWAAVWDFIDIKSSQPYTDVIDDASRMPGAQWFRGAKMNYAENLLRYRDDQTALISIAEFGPERRISYRMLFEKVARLAQALRAAGVGPGDRVAGFMPNIPETVMGMLAAASIGAFWSSCSPDFGVKGVLDRLGQIQPKVLFTTDGYGFKGRVFDSLTKIKDMMPKLQGLQQIVVVPLVESKDVVSAKAKDIDGAILYDHFLADTTGVALTFAQVPFDHPLFVMYSSGTTGLPKCLVQSGGGVLLNHLKELVLHTNLTRDDTIFYYTTCGWMMWNWLVSSLAVGATLLLYDGSPFYPDPEAIWKIVQDHQVSIFGTSAAYLAAIEAEGVRPAEKFDLSALNAVLSTGSPLSPESFEYVYRDIKPDLQLSSISGGTDINGCFALGNPTGSVYSGELQCRGLGMKVVALDDGGHPVVNEQGELACLASSPSMPVYFWNDPDGKKYRDAYFNRYPNIWIHGDFIKINDRGGVVIYGRSDATLNPGGVRIGTADIYRLMAGFPEIEDSVVVGQEWKNDVRVILFVKMAPGYDLTEEYMKKIKTFIRANASPRHVPAKIIAVPDIPYTLNMKKVEIAVKKVLQGKAVQNKDSLKNPESLDYYQALRPLLEQD